MLRVEKHVPGDFCWIELATTDQTAAKKFYSELFGWDIHEFTMAPNDFFTSRWTAAMWQPRIRFPPSSGRKVFRLTGTFMSRWRMRTPLPAVGRSSKRKCLPRRLTCSTRGEWQVWRTPREQVFSPGRANATTGSGSK